MIEKRSHKSSLELKHEQNSAASGGCFEKLFGVYGGSKTYCAEQGTVDFLPSICFIPEHLELNALLEKLTKL